MGFSVKKSVLSAAVAIITAVAMTLSVSAKEHYDVYSYDSQGNAVPSQAGYSAKRAVSGEELGIGQFSSPSDIFKDSNDVFYIADTGNNRIAAVDGEFEKAVRVWDSFTLSNGKKTTLNSPTGVFVSSESLMYIADSGNSRVLVCDMEGNVTLEITKPDSPIYDQELTFLPQKVIADGAGNIYVVLKNTTSGAAMFDSSGDFTGYYGANPVTATADVIANRFWNSVLSDEARAKRKRNVPSGFTNFDIDSEGFIYTSNPLVKKLNAGGDNLFSDYELHIGDYVPEGLSSEVTETQIVDIDIGDDGSINCLDLSNGRVFQYDSEANLMFIMGTKSSQLGGFSRCAALETKGNSIYVLDCEKNTVTIFEETKFGELVHSAAALYNSGCYDEALELWYEILKRDGNYRRANIGAASAMLSQGEYKSAMEYAKKAGDTDIYNKAFAMWRSQLVRENMDNILWAAVAAAAVAVTVKILRKRKEKGDKNAGHK